MAVRKSHTKMSYSELKHRKDVLLCETKDGFTIDFMLT